MSKEQQWQKSNVQSFLYTSINLSLQMLAYKQMKNQ